MAKNIMNKLLGYIIPIGISIQKCGINDFKICVAKDKDCELSVEFSTDNSQSHINTFDSALTELFSWLPNTRYFFFSSKKKLMKDLQSEDYALLSDLLVKHLTKDTWAKILTYLNIDNYLEMLEVGSLDELSSNSQETEMGLLFMAYNLVIRADQTLLDRVRDKVIQNEKALREFKNSYSWDTLIRSKCENLNDIFGLCGNHMLPLDFQYVNNTDLENIKIANFNITSRTTKETFQADAQNLSILGCTKVFFSISSNYEINMQTPENLKFKTKINPLNVEKSIKSIIEMQNLLPLKRIFITDDLDSFERLKEIREMFLKSNLEISSLFISDILETKVIFSQAFRKIFPSLNFKSICKILDLENSNPSLLLLQFDKEILNHPKETIERLTQFAYSYLAPMNLEEVKKKYENLLSSVFGQILKYIYCIIPETT